MYACRGALLLAVGVKVPQNPAQRDHIPINTLRHRQQWQLHTHSLLSMVLTMPWCPCTLVQVAGVLRVFSWPLSDFKVSFPYHRCRALLIFFERFLDSSSIPFACGIVTRIVCISDRVPDAIEAILTYFWIVFQITVQFQQRNDLLNWGMEVQLLDLNPHSSLGKSHCHCIIPDTFGSLSRITR